jgi:HK97 family phage major capsid protein
MNTAQLAAQRRELDTESAEVDRLISAAISSKSFSGMGALEARVDQLAADRAELDQAEVRAKAMAAHPLSGMDMASAADGPMPATKAFGGRITGGMLSPLTIPGQALKDLHGAASQRQSLSVKAFSTVEGLLPAQLDPNVLGKIHENRLLDRLPAQAITAPSYEIVVHNSTTGAPTSVAEGGQKPELVFNNTSLTLTAVKLATHFGISYETLQDFANFESYAMTEGMAQLQDVENAQLIAGDGTGTNMTGFLHTSGILTHDASGDTGTGVTVIDSLIKAIAQLRVGSALATADLLVIHPNTWSAIQRLKDTTGRFLFISADSDPSHVQGNAILGVPVLTTTSIAAGTGLMLDTQKFGRVLIRESISVHTGTSGLDLISNIQRFVLEERLVLAVERPAAVINISNLPTS